LQVLQLQAFTQLIRMQLCSKTTAAHMHDIAATCVLKMSLNRNHPSAHIDIMPKLTKKDIISVKFKQIYGIKTDRRKKSSSSEAPSRSDC